jgi:hypothetical protein
MAACQRFESTKAYYEGGCRMLFATFAQARIAALQRASG